MRLAPASHVITAPSAFARARRGTFFLKTALLAAASAIVNEVIGQATVMVFDVSPEFLPLRLGGAALSTVVPVLAAAVLLLVLRRVAARPERVFWIVSTVVLLVSYVPVVALALDPSEIPGTTPAAIVSLGVMHVVAFALAVPLLLRFAREVR